MRRVRNLIAASLSTALLLPSGAGADVMSTKNRVNLFKSQTKILDTRARQQYNSSVRLQPPSVRTPSKYEDVRHLRYDGRYKGQYVTLARDAARRHGVPEDLFLRLVQ